MKVMGFSCYKNTWGIPWGEKDPHGSAYGEAVPSSTVALLVEGFKEEALVRKLRLVGFETTKTLPETKK